MKVLLDAMLDGWHDRLLHMGYDVASVKDLDRRGHKLEGDDRLMIEYAREHGMILITKDQRCGRNCEAVGIRCILLGDDQLFQILLAKLAEYGDPAGKA